MSITINAFFDKGIVRYITEDIISKDIPESVKVDDNYGIYLYMPAPNISGNIAYREFLRSYLKIYVSDGAYSNPNEWPRCSTLEEWDYDKVDSVAMLPKGLSTEAFDGANAGNMWFVLKLSSLSDDYLQSILSTGCRIRNFHTRLWLPNSDAAPHLSFELGDLIGVTINQLYPTSLATVSKSLPTPFQWSSTPTSTNTLSPVGLKSCKLRWRYLGDSSYTEIALGAVSEYTLPAGTFESGTIEWQIEATANSDVVTKTTWILVSVAEPTPTANALSPQNTVVDGSLPIQFIWEHIISNGTQQTAFDLQISHDLQTWTTIVSKETAETSTTVPENTFTSGDLYWCVRTYNLDGVAGDWSEPAHCIVIAAPSVPAVTVTEAAPRFSIRWHQHDQQGYEIMLDKTVIAKKYGASSAYTHTKHLSPGAYSVKVRIQNQYGLWSSWGEALLNISASAEPSISLSVQVETHIVQLSWETEGAYDSFLIYRNGTQIAEVTGREYQDQFAAGEAVYQVRGIYSDSGECGLSNQDQVFVEIKTMLISDINDPHWIELPHSTSSLRSTSMSRSHSVAYSHFIGSALPSADIGEAEYQTLELDCAWKNADLTQAHAFENLTGRSVVIKTITGRLIAAVMDSVRSEENRFWTAYQAQLTPIEWEETAT